MGEILKKNPSIQKLQSTISSITIPVSKFQKKKKKIVTPGSILRPQYGLKVQ